MVKELKASLNKQRMKRIGNLYSKIISIDNLILADKKARKGKLKQYGVIKHLQNQEQNIQNLNEILKHNKFKTSEYKIFKIYEGKEREIYQLPYYPDRIIHHAIMNILEPIFTSVFTSDTYSCIKGRGVHKASYNLRKVLEDKENTKYCLKLDINKFYPSVDNEILKQTLRKKFKDVALLNMLDEIIDSTEGLPIGSYLSQYLGNFYLTYFDHFIKEVLKVKYYFRYCDDIILLSNNKKELHRWFTIIEKYLLEELNLKVKNNYQIFPVNKRGIDWCGYKHYHTHTLIRKTIKKKYIKSKNKMNHNGWLIHCNSINLRNKYENTRI